MKDLFGEDIKERAKTSRGGGDSVYKMLGASNHCKSSRQEEDYYATDPRAVHMLCELEEFDGPILEPSCGEGHISKALKQHGYIVESRDLVYRGFGMGGCDFLGEDTAFWGGDIVMNPPYNLATEFVCKALQIVGNGRKVAAFLKLTFAEGKSRKELFQSNPPKTVYVSSSRLECGKNGVFGAGSAVCYAWFVWEKGFSGNTTMKWFN